MSGPPAPRKHSGPIRIISDGSGMSSIVMDGNDTVIDNVTSVTIWVEHNELTRADLTILAPVLDVKAHLGTTSLLCTICNDTHDHDCKPDTIGGI